MSQDINQNTSYEKSEAPSKSADSQSQLSTEIWNELKEASKSVIQAVKGAADASLNQFGQLDLKFDSLYETAFKQPPQDKICIPKGEIGTTIPLDDKARIPQGELPTTPNPLDNKISIPKNELSTAIPLNDKVSIPKNELPTTPNPLDGKIDKTKEGSSESNPFHGAEINKDIEPGTHTVKPGDTLTKIAKQHLGPDATPQEIQQHVKEIAKLNGIKNPDLIIDGHELKLPGHTADGGTVTISETGDRITAWKDNTLRVDHTDSTGYIKTPDGSELHWGPKNQDNYSVRITEDGGREVTDYNTNKTTTWADGVVRHENADGTGDVRRPIEGGGYSEHHWGPNQKDNFDIVKTAEGKYRIGEKDGDKVGHEPKDAGEKLVAERQRLNDKLQERLGNDPEALARAKADMEAFEKRAAAQNPPLSPEELAKTYDQISKLLESSGEQPVSQADRVKIAEQVLHQSAHPNEVRQGYHNTCNVTTVESRMYTRNPSEAARVVTEAATTGQVTMSDGRVVPITPASLAPDSQAIHHPSPDNERSHASQIFQLAAVNDYYDRVNRSTTPAGQVRYEQVTPTGPNDTGERLMNYATTPPSALTDAAGNQISPPAIPTSELQNISNDITGKNEKDFVIINGMYGDANTVKVKSEKELGEQLEQMKKDGKLPAIIWVDAQNEPFFTDSGAGSNGGSGGAHVVTITDYDPATGKVQIDNQWDQADDHAVSLHDLYIATRPASSNETIKAYEADNAWDSLVGTEDGFKEFEVLRLKKNAGKLTDAEYDAAIIASMKEQQKRWAEDGETYPGEKQRAMDKYKQMLGFLPAARAQAIKTAVAAS